MVAEAQRTPPSSGRPELSFVRMMTEPFGRWERKGDYAIWTGSRGAGESKYLLLELHDKGVLPIVKGGAAPIMHRIPHGVPHHVTHLFGFWHVADVDAVWLQAKRGETEYYSLMLGGTVGRPAMDACLWICPKCANLLIRHDFDTARNGFDAFLRFALEKVRAFNGDPARRTCKGCGAVHPPAHGFYPDDDTADERAARLAE